MELKNALFSPNSVIRTPTFRTKGSITFAYSFAFIFLACTIIFLFGNSHVHQSSSQWFKNVIKNRSQLSSYFPHHNHLSQQNLSEAKDSVFNPELNQSRVSSNGSRNATLSEGKSTAAKKKKKKKRWVELMSKCDVFDGKWVRDNSPPFYEPGSCPFIDESFNCYLNGRPDTGYEKLRWQPNHCNVPRW